MKADRPIISMMNATPPPSRPTTVAVVYHFLPHYRKGVFEALQSSPDMEVTFITGHSRPGQEGVEEASGLHPIEVKNRWVRGTFLWQSGLLPHLWRQNYDAVIFLGNWMWITTWLGAALTRLRGGGVLFWTHGWTAREGGPQGFLRRSFYRLSNRLLLYGERAAQIGRSYGFSDESLVVIGNSIPLPDQGGPLPEPFELPAIANPDLPMVLWIARLIEEKRPDLLIDAVAAASANGKPLNLCFVGDGDEADVARREAESKIPGQVAFLGGVHDEAVLSRVFAAAAVTAVPDYGGLTIPHSFIHGVPVVANDEAAANGPEYEYLYPGFNGSIFPRGDVNALAAELVRWAYDEPLAGTTRDAVIERARQDASPQANADRVMKAVSALLMSRRA